MGYIVRWNSNVLVPVFFIIVIWMDKSWECIIVIYVSQEVYCYFNVNSFTHSIVSVVILPDPRFNRCHYSDLIIQDLSGFILRSFINLFCILFSLIIISFAFLHLHQKQHLDLTSFYLRSNNLVALWLNANVRFEARTIIIC